MECAIIVFVRIGAVAGHSAGCPQVARRSIRLAGQHDWLVLDRLAIDS
jgi:hypothetical protein